MVTLNLSDEEVAALQRAITSHRHYLKEICRLAEIELTRRELATLKQLSGYIARQKSYYQSTNNPCKRKSQGGK